MDGTRNNPDELGSESMDLDHIHMESSHHQMLKIHKPSLHHAWDFLLDLINIDVKRNILQNSPSVHMDHHFTMNSKHTRHFFGKMVRLLHRTLGFQFCLAQVRPSINGPSFGKIVRPSDHIGRTLLAWSLEFAAGNGK
ncbi:hypothetical protein HAX54_047067 [Datura stramonium]|uniref:Uncharacterized protein n=1 Tax=Datura stramonium TaxID=4076 RepID=A0ABS8SS83_DATST|nr:hypothetical protein [Datura stramonium]